MKDGPLEAPRIEGAADVAKIAEVAGGKRGQEAAILAQALTASPEFPEKVKGILASVNLSENIPADGQFVSKDKIGKLYDSIHDQISGPVAGWDNTEVEELLNQSGEIKMDDVAVVVSCVYAYYLLKMVQDEYDKFPQYKKSNIISYSLKTDGSGKVSVEFVEAEGPQGQPDPAATAAVGTTTPETTPGAVPAATVGTTTPETTAPVEVAGIKPKSGKSFSDMKNYVEAIPELTLASFKDTVPKDFKFDWQKLEPKIRAVLNSDANKAVVEGFKADLGNIFENVDEANFVSFFSKAAAVYYTQNLKAEFDKTYEPAKMASITDWATNPEYTIDYELKIDAGVPAVVFTSDKFQPVYDKASQAATGTLDDTQQKVFDALKTDTLIGTLVSMSGEGEALLGKVVRKESAGFFGFLIAIVAGIKGIPGFRDTWVTVKSYLPESMKPLGEQAETWVKKGEEKVREMVGKKNDDIIKFLEEDEGYTVPKDLLGGLRFAEDFEPKQGDQFTCMEVTIKKGQEVNFGDNVTSGITKDGQTTDYQVTDKKLREEGVYKITCRIPKETVFSPGITLKLVKNPTAVAKPAADAAAPAPAAADATAAAPATVPAPDATATVSPPAPAEGSAAQG